MRFHLEVSYMSICESLVAFHLNDTVSEDVEYHNVFLKLLAFIRSILRMPIPIHV